MNKSTIQDSDSQPELQQGLMPLSEGMPAPEEHDRVIIYTEGVDFAGEQYFHVKAEDLLPEVNADPDDPEADGRTEVCRAATHWMPEPGTGPVQHQPLTRDEFALAAKARELVECRETLRDLNTQIATLQSAGHTLTTRLCAIGTVAEKDGYELIRRDSVMDFVTEWRAKTNAVTLA